MIHFSQFYQTYFLYRPLGFVSHRMIKGKKIHISQEAVLGRAGRGGEECKKSIMLQRLGMDITWKNAVHVNLWFVAES